jgi:hypothetical protein
MAVDGTWNLVVNTPMGTQESTLVISTSGSTLTGTQSAGSGEGRPIEEGTVDGNDISWKAAITKPMPMTLVFTGTVDGDQLTGQVKLGMFGSASFTGSRA